jgi:hypothetical protein
VIRARQPLIRPAGGCMQDTYILDAAEEAGIDL